MPGSDEAFCHVCRMSTKVLEINRNLRSEMQVYFRNPKDLASQFMSQLKSVIEFQEKQKASFLKFEIDKRNKALKCAKEMQSTLKKRSIVEKQMLVERTEMKAQLEVSAAKIKSLEAKLAEKDVEIEKLTKTRTQVPESEGSLISFYLIWSIFS